MNNTDAYKKGRIEGSSRSCNKAAKMIGEKFGFDSPTKHSPSKNLKKAIKKARKMLVIE
jgi:hypothetical protein